jgi:hypothetical protein
MVISLSAIAVHILVYIRLYFVNVLDDLKEKRRYWKLGEDALDRTLWRTRFGRDYGPFVRQTTE